MCSSGKGSMPASVKDKHQTDTSTLYNVLAECRTVRLPAFAAGAAAADLPSCLWLSSHPHCPMNAAG